MRQSHQFSTTRRIIAGSEEAINAVLLPRGGYVERTAAGAYSYLPMGLRVLRKISAIVRDELDALPFTSEVQMTVLQPRELWLESDRWDDAGMKEVMYRLEDGAMGLGPTHEENITDLFRTFFSSYKQLPIAAYQIQTKFRKEARPKSGILRGREFLMKDLYSFHTSEADLDAYYDQVAQAYLRIYARLGLEAIMTEASGGVFSKQHSHEFQVICPIGEDTIYLSADGKTAWNEEVVTGVDDPKLLEYSGGTIRSEKAVEVGNIFHLGQKFTNSMKAEVSLEDGSRLAPYMGCYGIGISRAMGVVVEKFGSVGGDNGRGAKIVWPKAIAPYAVHLIALGERAEAEELYKQLKEGGIEVLFDDRIEQSAGEKFADADLIGAPVRLVVSERSLAAGGVELQMWPDGEKKIVSLSDVASCL